MVDTKGGGDVFDEIGWSEENTTADEYSNGSKRRRIQRKDPSVMHVRSRKTPVGKNTSQDKKTVIKPPLNEAVRKEGERVGERPSNRRGQNRTGGSDSRYRGTYYDE